MIAWRWRKDGEVRPMDDFFMQKKKEKKSTMETNSALCLIGSQTEY